MDVEISPEIEVTFKGGGKVKQRKIQTPENHFVPSQKRQEMRGEKNLTMCI